MISRELWLQVEPLLDTALGMPESEHEGWLEHVGAAHPEAAPLLRQLVRAHLRAERAR